MSDAVVLQILDKHMSAMMDEVAPILAASAPVKCDHSDLNDQVSDLTILLERHQAFIGQLVKQIGDIGVGLNGLDAVVVLPPDITATFVAEEATEEPPLESSSPDPSEGEESSGDEEPAEEPAS